MSDSINFDELFERRLVYPDPDAQTRLASLVGLDGHKSRLTKALSLLVNPKGLQRWIDQYHPAAKNAADMILRRPPLVVLAGDVGSGKTALAESIGDAVARQENIDLTLLPLSLASRGQGRVGEMTRLISAAFQYTLDEAERYRNREDKAARGGVILLVDEADSLAQSRETAQMHHEDRAGVNAFIRGVDQLSNSDAPAAVIMCTNRLQSLDPAVRRRAAELLAFKRPDEAQRRAVLVQPLKDLGFGDGDIDTFVHATGAKNGQTTSFSFSDLVQRAVPAIILDAYPDKAVQPERALEVIRSMTPTPAFQEEN